jgi:hypothetical protein
MRLGLPGVRRRPARPGKNIIHDELIVEDPTKQLDRHDCDEERVRRVLEF